MIHAKLVALALTVSLSMTLVPQDSFASGKVKRPKHLDPCKTDKNSDACKMRMQKTAEIKARRDKKIKELKAMKKKAHKKHKDMKKDMKKKAGY